MDNTIFKLVCLQCGAKDERPANDCKGSDNPVCKKCMGPMTIYEAIYKSK